MRLLLGLICLACAGAAPALETARELASSGAARLALNRVEQQQPRESTAPRWADWEALRMSLLVRLRQYDEALRRVGTWPAAMPAAALRPCLLEAARAAVATGQPALARAYAARVMWQLEGTPGEARAARLVVIESHIAEQQGATAFRAMLRFQQDYRPLESGVAERFVEALLDLGLDTEAVNWLASLGDESALKLRLQMRTGLVTPDVAVERARVQLARGGAPGYWRVLAEAAARQGSNALRMESLERLLHHGEGEGARRLQALADGLWKSYLAEGQTVANQNRLLAGDDNAWMDFAARRLGSNPLQSRAVFALLSRNAAAQDVRMGAQLQLVFSLYQDALDHAALRLFSEEPADPAAIDPQARYLLGSIAETRNAVALAVRFWQGLATPPSTGAEEWRVRLATVQWRSGMSAAAVDSMRALAKQAKPLPAAATTRAIALAREMLGAGKPDLAEEALLALLPVAGREHAREILHALGGIAESAAQYARAADYYLRAALAADARAPDGPALQARLAAGINLARAGYKEDARTQFEWLLKNSKDAAQRDAARRELAKL